MFKPLIALPALMIATPAAAATMLANGQCRATTDPASPVVVQLWGGETVHIIGRTTGWVRLDRGDQGCWVSVAMVAERGETTAPVYDRGAIRDQMRSDRSCSCNSGRACVDRRDRRYCITRNGNRRRLN